MILMTAVSSSLRGRPPDVVCLPLMGMPTSGVAMIKARQAGTEAA